MEQFLDNLSKSLKNPLPGKEAHIKMIPKGRLYTFPRSNFIESAVNIILFPNDKKIHFLLTKRSQKMTNHAGQISLPGGKKDKSDKDLWTTAKRETHEETEIFLNDDNYIGKLSKLYIPVTNFYIQPYISFINKKPVLPTKTVEVDDFFSVNIKNFFLEGNISTKIKKHKNKFIEIPYFNLEKNIVWGATAMILFEFRQIIH